MNLLINKDILLKAVMLVEKNIGRNLTLPVLNNILIKTEDKKLHLISTDLELALWLQIPAKIEQEGSIAVSPRIISGFLSNIPEGTVHVKSEKQTLFLEQKNHTTSIKGEKTDEYPLIPKIKKDTFFIIPSVKLIPALNQTINAAALSDLKPELTGVLFNFSKDELKLASTDTFRLSEKTIKLSAQNNASQKIIVPAKAVQEIIRVYQNTEEDLYFYIDKNQIALENKESQTFTTQLISKTVEGDYPDYTQIVPQKHTTTAIVSKNNLLKQIKSASFFTSKVNDVRLTVGKNTLTIHAQDYDIGEFQSSLEAAVEGDSKKTTFNYQYLLDGLTNIEGDEVVIKFNQEDAPVVIESTKHKDYFYVLMPIKK